MKQISETIDGSIKDIIQLKTLDNSLEYSQMFDALEDTPREFQLKLVDALNSLGETMQVPPTEAFNKVLCKSDDGNEDVTKKLYNWWRAFFEVLGKCEKIPNDRKTEFNQKIDDLMAEIMKAGDTEATDEEEPVMESSDDEFGYQQATKDDEDKMLADMEFAVQHIGEVANKVKAVVDFINPYCGTEVNESGDQPKFKVGDVVRVMNASGMDLYGRDAPIGSIVKIEPPHPDVGVYEYLIKGRSGEFFAYEDELELFPERFTEENDDMDKPARYGIGDHVLYKGEECVVTDVDEDLRNDEEIYQVSRDSDKVDGLSFNDWATWDELEPLEGFTENIGKFNFRVGDKVKVVGRGLASKGWIGVVSSVDKSSPGLPYTVDFEGRESGEYAPDELTLAKGFTEEEKNTMKFKKIDERIGGGSDEWVSIDDYVGEEFSESDDKKQFGEAKVVVDANDVWDVLDLLDNDIAHNELTDLINSHVRTEDEIMDAIDELCGETITQKELNTLLSGRMATLVDYLGLDVEEYENMGNFKDSDKPTSVELEANVVDEGFWGGFLGGVAGFFLGGGLLGTVAGAVAGSKLQNYFHKRDVVKNLDDVQLLILASCKEAAANGVTADDLKKALEKNKDVDIAKEVNGLVDVGVIKKNGDTIMITAEGKEVLQKAGYDEKAVQNTAKKEADKNVGDNNGSSEEQMAAESDWDEKHRERKEDTGKGQNPEEIKNQDKIFNQDGENKTLVAGEGDNKKPVCEMTIEQEVSSPQSLLRLLWEQGKEHLIELLNSEYVDNDAIMPTLEDMGLRNLTEINDAFAYDFETILDSLGLDGKAWSQNLEIKRKGDDSED